MDRELSREPENPAGNYALSERARQIQTMSIHEHASLVQAIMVNFPEIFEEQPAPESTPKTETP